MSVFDRLAARRAAGLTNYGGSIGRVAKSDSAESDQMMNSVTGEGDALTPVRHPKTGEFLPASDPRVTEMVKSAPAQVKAAVKVLRNPKSNGHEHLVASSVVNGWAGKEGNAGDAQTPGVEGPRLNGAADASDVGVVGGEVSAEYIRKMRRVIDSSVATPAEKEILGERLTKALLAASHAPAPGKLAKATLVPENPNNPIERLRELVKSKDLDPTLRSEVGQLLTRHDLALKATEDQMTVNVNAGVAALAQRDATAAQVRASQASATGSPQSLTGVSSEAQTRMIGSGTGSPMSLGEAQAIGNRGDLTGGQGRLEGEPLPRVIEQVEDELQCAKSVIERARIGETLTYLRLRGAREGLIPA